MTGPLLHRKPKRFIKKPAKRFTSKGLLLYLLPIFAIPATIIAFGKGNLLGIGVNALGYALFIAAASLLRRGVAAEAAYHEKRISHPPKRPLKTFAAITVAFATGLIAWLGAGQPMFVSIAFGLGAFGGMFLTYGFDPRVEKMVTGSHGYSAEEITQTIDEAEQKISAIELANDRIGNREFNNRINRICDVARSILEGLEEDPGDIRRARKFLNVYLDGAKKVTEGYAKTHEQTESEKLEQNFRNVLESIETVFVEQKEKLLENNVFDLDVQMEVLASQLKREGVI